jgi:hypothetical protein
MDRIETIITKVRPIKKLFILDPDDRATFLRCLRLCSEEILGIKNLFLINNERLLTENTIAFVRAHDPDVVINYSSRDANQLYRVFKTLVKNGTGTSLNPSHFSTKLMSFQNRPTVFQGLNELGLIEGTEETVFTVILPEDTADLSDMQFFFSLNCGLIDNDELGHLDWTIFRGVAIRTIENLEDFWQVLKKPTSNFLNLCSPYHRFTDHHSIWEVEYNEQRYFRKPSVIIGDSSDLDSIVYFWNVRASYSESQILWMPYQMLEAHKERLGEYEQYCLSNVTAEDASMDSSLEGKVHIDSSRYYFPNRDDWQTFDFLQQGTVVDNALTINHPKEKLFSSLGMNLCFMLEVRRLEDFLLPNSSGIGELFIKSPRLTSIEHFTRISNRGLSTARFDLEFPSDQSLFSRVSLPETKDVFKVLFSEYGLRLIETEKSIVTGRIINLVGGPDRLRLFRNQRIFDLIVSLAPPRVKRIVKELLKEIEREISEGRIYEILEKNIGHLTTINTRPIVDADQLLSRASEQAANRSVFFSRIQELYDKRILLRGKRYDCASCGSELWFPLEAIQDDLRCYCCGERTSLPVHSDGRILVDAFRLNELVAAAVDQGVLPVLLTILFLTNQGFRGMRFMYDIEILSESTRLAEADLIFTFGKKLGLAEVKADRGFDLNQVDRLLSVSDTVGADTIVFSTLKSAESDEVIALSGYLSDKGLRIPVFIAGREALFAEETPDLSKYFELIRGEKRFPSGPIIFER